MEHSATGRRIHRSNWLKAGRKQPSPPVAGFQLFASGWEVARKLDGKVERLLSAVANGRDLALLFKDLATLRTDARLFGDVDEFRWRGPTKAFAACDKHLRDARLLERSLKAPVA